MALLKEASEMFDETGCVPGIDGEEVPAERIVPDAREYISETIDDPEAIYDPAIWDTPGFALVVSWLAQKWQRRCQVLRFRGRLPNVEYRTREYLTEREVERLMKLVDKELLTPDRFRTTICSAG